MIVGAYVVLHGLLEFHVIHRGFMVPTLWEILEWVLTFPLSIWQVYFGLPDNLLGRLFYYILVVANSIFLSSIIGQRHRNGSGKSDAEEITESSS